MRKPFVILRVIPVFAVFLMVFPLLCYSQGTTGTLRGFVTEKGAEALPGVTIEINSPGMMGTRSAITDNRGAYRLFYLPPGRYNITAKIDGFGTVSKNNVSIQAGKTTTIDFELEQAGLEETITVTAAAPVIDSERSDRSYTIPVDVLQELPLGARIDFGSAWAVLPGVIQTGVNSEVNAANTVHQGWHYESDYHENRVSLDGVVLNSMAVGVMYAEVGAETFEEIDIIAAGAPAEYGSARSSFLNIVTKSGGNTFHGEVHAEYRPQSWNWTNVPNGVASKMSYLDPSFTLEGPIIQDKLWFMASLKHRSQDYQFPNTIVEPKMVREIRQWLPHIKLTFQPHKNHSISVFYQNNLEITTNDYGGEYAPREYSTLAALYKIREGGHVGGLTWRWIPSNDLIINFVAGFTLLDHKLIPLNLVPKITYHDRYLGNIVKVDEGGGMSNLIAVRETLSLASMATWFRDDLWGSGAHEFKLGGEIRPDLPYPYEGQLFYEDARGFYKYEYAMDYANYGLSAPYLYEATSVSPGNGYSSEPGWEHENVFIQDLWTVSKNLTFSLGLRWERNLNTTPGRDKLPSWMDKIYSGIRNNVEVNDSGLAPRLGATYNWEGIGVFKIHLGRYFEHMAMAFYTHSPERILYQTYRVNPANFGAGPEALEFYSGALTGVPYPHYSKDVKAEYNDELFVSFERELFKEIVFDAAYVYRNTYPNIWHTVDYLFEDGQFIGYKFPEYQGITEITFSKWTKWNYKSLQFNLKRNFTDRWGFITNFSYYWQEYRWSDFDPGSPLQFVYANPSDMNEKNGATRWTCRASAFYRLPWDITLATYVSGQSGIWVNDLDGDYGVFDAAPRIVSQDGRVVTDVVWLAKNSYFRGKSYGQYGRTTEPLWNVNIRLQKGFSVSRVRLTAAVDVFNVFNWAAIRSFGSADIRNTARYSLEYVGQAPRSAQVNLRVQF